MAFDTLSFERFLPATVEGDEILILQLNHGALNYKPSKSTVLILNICVLRKHAY